MKETDHSYENHCEFDLIFLKLKKKQTCSLNRSLLHQVKKNRILKHQQNNMKFQKKNTEKNISACSNEILRIETVSSKIMLTSELLLLLLLWFGAQPSIRAECICMFSWYHTHFFLLHIGNLFFICSGGSSVSAPRHTAEYTARAFFLLI